MNARRRIAAPKAQSRYGLCFGMTLLQRGFATGGERGQKSFCVALTAANLDWRLDFGGPSPSPLGRGRRVQCCRAQRRRFATGQREDCSAEYGSPSLAGLESGVSQPSFWPLFSFSTARLMKSSQCTRHGQIGAISIGSIGATKWRARPRRAMTTQGA